MLHANMLTIVNVNDKRLLSLIIILMLSNNNPEKYVTYV